MMHTLQSLKTQLQIIGLKEGDLIMTHASLRKIGEIEGRGETLIKALLDTIGVNGTLVMVLGSPSGSVFDVNSTPTDPEMGMLTELFRKYPGVKVNDHAAARFAAYGPLATELFRDTTLHDYYSQGSVLDKIFQNKGVILRMGANMDTVTLTHFAEYLANVPNKNIIQRKYTRKDIGVQVINSLDDSNGIRTWPHGDYFPQIFIDFLTTGKANIGKVGDAKSELFKARDFVPFAVDWMEREFSTSAQ